MSRGLVDALQVNEGLVAELHRLGELLIQNETDRRELERTVDHLATRSDQAQLALAQAEEERERVLNEQDKFLASLLEEHEEQLIELRSQQVDQLEVQRRVAERERERMQERLEQALHDLEELRGQQQRELARLQQAWAQRAKVEHAEIERRMATERTANDKQRRAEHQRELDAVRAQLAAERDRHVTELERLQSECDASEARLAAATAQSDQLREWLERQQHATEAELGAPPCTSSVPVDPRFPPAEAAVTGDAATDEELPYPLEAETPGESDGRESELAVALAATDPEQRRRRRRAARGEQEPAKAVVAGRSDACHRSLVGYSVSGLEPEQTVTRSPRER